ncbi:MAG: DUF1638 domain-containing protein [Syntrophobacteraceae bacterium]
MASKVIIACRVMQAELDEIRAGDPDIEIVYLDQALHRRPDKMRGLIQEQIDHYAGHAERIVLGYGLCSNGVVGVNAKGQGLIIPRAHDCIALLLGSCAAYNECFAGRPGTYYLSRGWIAEKKDPLGITEEEYTERVGREMAIWAMTRELEHYTHITLIRTGNVDENLVERARKNAEFFSKQYSQFDGSMDYFNRIVHGPWDRDDFLLISPYCTITQDLWFPDNLKDILGMND